LRHWREAIDFNRKKIKESVKLEDKQDKIEKPNSLGLTTFCLPGQMGNFGDRFFI